MKVIYGIGSLKHRFKNVVLAIGVFDGVHKGHQKLIQQALSAAEKIKGHCMVMTFWPHPVQVLRPEVYLPHIVSLKHRLKLLESLGVDSTLVVRFTKRFSKQSPENFVKRYLGQRIKPIEVFVGDDFRFGSERSGGIDLFKKMGERFGIKVHGIHTLKTTKKKIGSSQIRELITSGELKKAGALLGRPVSVMGTVLKGARRGHKLGYPTVNIYPKNQLIPPIGVYVARIHAADKVYKGMANVGRRPTFGSSYKRINVEANIFDFSGSLYGQEIIIDFIKKIRNEKVFHTTQELVAQLEKDKKAALRIL